MRHERDLARMAGAVPAGRQDGEPERAAGIGAPLRRLEDERLLRGSGRFTGDLAAGSGALAMAVVRSPHAHAEIEAIDPTAAQRLPGVAGVLTAADLDRQGIADLPCDWVPPGMAAAPLHPVLARDRVLYAGQPVAAVVARSVPAALDAAEAVAVSYRPLAVLADQEAALAAGAAALHEAAPGNLGYRFRRQAGRPAAAIAAAPVQLRRRYRNNRLAPAPMEGRAVLSSYDPAAGRLTHVTGSQLPHVHARALADCLGLPMHRLDFRSPDVGGGFGAKLCFYPEDVLAAVAAMRFGAAIRWEESRSEGFLATTHGRDHLQEVVLAADRDGRIRALQVRLTADLGAYAIGMGPGVPAINAGLSVSGPYRIDDLSVEVVGVYSNRTPTGPYRGAGHPEATYLIERAIDDLAATLGQDPAEVRRRNLLSPGDLPRRLPTGFALDGGDFAATMDKVLAMGRDAGLAARRAAAPDGHARGIGLAVYSELSGAAPSMGKGAVGFRRAGHESARLVMHPDGRVTLFSGTHSQGQGHATALAQIAAQVLQVPEADIAVVQGEAGRIPFGTGTYNSRSMAVGGAAVHRAARQVLARARRIAAGQLGCRPRDLAYRDGRFIAPSGPGAALRRRVAALGRRVKGRVFRRLTGLTLPSARAPLPGPAADIPIADVARLAHLGHDLPLGMAPGLEAVASFDPRGMPAANGAHLALVDVDLESGEVRLLEHLAAEDCGTVINPLLAAGQVHGGIAQGAGQALMEAMVHDPEGQPLSGSFGDYAVPRAADLPSFGTGHVVTPSRLNPLGARGIGEGGAIGAPPAIVNAVLDALRPHGVAALDMPLTPERIWRALQAARDGDGDGNGNLDRDLDRDSGDGGEGSMASGGGSRVECGISNPVRFREDIMGALDPGAKLVLDLVEKAQAEGAKPIDQQTPAEARQTYENQRGPLTPEPPEVAAVRDFAVPGPRGEIPVRLYRPAGSSDGAALPVIVFYHGGGWVIGSLNTHDVVCRGLANHSGCAVLSVDYRMGPEDPFPAAGEDCYAVLEWLIAAGEGQGLDSTRIGVAGDSAGGNLSAVMTLMVREQNGPSIAWQGLIYPATDMRGGYESRKAFGEGYLLTQAAMDYFEGHYLQGPGPRTDWRASPILADDLAGLPPATIVTAGFDPLRDEGKAYADRLRDAGVPVTYKCFDGQIHGFFTMGRVIPEAEAGIRLIAEGARAVLKP